MATTMMTQPSPVRISFRLCSPYVTLFGVRMLRATCILTLSIAGKKVRLLSVPIHPLDLHRRMCDMEFLTQVIRPMTPESAMLPTYASLLFRFVGKRRTDHFVSPQVPYHREHQASSVARDLDS
jgi:hypothetical protein